MTRWTLVISEETDRSLRTFLALTGGKKGDLSNFVEQAVRDKIFHESVSRIKQTNQDASQDEITRLIDEAVMNVRSSSPRS